MIFGPVTFALVSQMARQTESDAYDPTVYTHKNYACPKVYWMASREITKMLQHKILGRIVSVPTLFFSFFFNAQSLNIKKRQCPPPPGHK